MKLEWLKKILGDAYTEEMDVDGMQGPGGAVCFPR